MVGEGEEEEAEVEEAEEEEQGEVPSQELELAIIPFSSETPAALSLQKTTRGGTYKNFLLVNF